jgi:hypothetical protein
MAVFGKRWTNAELDLLKTTDELEELTILLPSRTKGAIKKKLLEVRSGSSDIWTEEELLQFPTERVVNKLILAAVAEKLSRSRDQVWRKMKSRGYVWDKDFKEEATEDNPYPDHGKKWTPEELALFPEDKLVNAEILEKVQALFPRRKPTSIWPKMKKEGYVWDKVEEEKPQLDTAEEEASLTHTPQENFVLSLAYELGFRAPTRGSAYALEPYLNPTSNERASIANKFDLPEDFTSGELYYAIGTRITPFPWEMEPIEEVATAYRNRDQASVKAAAQALYDKLGKYLNG